MPNLAHMPNCRISNFTFKIITTLALMVGLSSFGGTDALAAENTLYSVTNNSPFTMYVVNTTTGAATSAGNLAFASAGIARQASTGLIYYTAINPTSGSNYAVATWNPATNVSTTLSGTINVYLPRLAFKADGTLYGMDSNNKLYTLNTVTGAFSSTIGTVSGGGLGTGLGGDISFSPTGTLYLIAGTSLYSITGTTSTLVGATGVGTALAGLAFATDGSLYTSDTNGANSGIYKLSTTTGAATLVGSSGATLADLAALPAFADLQITKSSTSGFGVGQNAAYSLSVKNNGPQSASGPITVSDTLPTGLSYVSATGTGWACSAAGSVVTCTNAGPVANGVTLGAITLTVAVASGAPPSVTNTASVSGTTFDHGPNNNSSSVTKPVMNVTLTKAVSPGGAQIPGADLTYTVTYTNSGGAAAQTIVVSDNIPANTDFKLSSESHTAPAGVTIAVDYWDSRPPTPQWVTAPTSDGTAPAGYARNITKIRWTFSGNLATSATGTVSFIVRIQ
jgi:uncharacterized repeat protein (TIGR01451 family)